MHKLIYQTFQQGSKTYFYSSLFFPKAIRDDVFILYSFVRVADNFVDAVPQDRKGFEHFVNQYHRVLKTGKSSGNVIIDQFVDLMQRKEIDKKDVKAFLDAMAQDLSQSSYNTMAETEAYMYGSAEVIGLMMAKVLNLPDESLPYAMSLGKAMQYVNFIRDIEEDLELERTYFPKTERKKYDINSLQFSEVSKNPLRFTSFVHAQLDYYRQWQAEGEKGYTCIPKRYRIPIKTAADMYLWTAKKIAADPMIVYRKKVKPSVPLIIATIIKNSLSA